MAHRITLSVLAVTITAISASAADLQRHDVPGQSRLGAIFAEPAEDVRLERVRRRESSEFIVGFNLMPSLPWERGGYNYGTPWSYYYGGPYYGTKPLSITAMRLPYACGLFGYCF